MDQCAEDALTRVGSMLNRRDACGSVSVSPGLSWSSA